MRMAIATFILIAFFSMRASADRMVANYGNSKAITTAAPIAEDTPKFRFILFWKENDAITQALSDGFQSAVAKHPKRAEWSSVNVSDQTKKELVEHYHMDRAPTPLVICIAPNGIITGAITRKLFDKAVEEALITPVMLEVGKAIREGKLVIVHVKPIEQSTLPTGAADLVSDPSFQNKVAVMQIVASNPAEARFLNDMKIKTADVSESLLVVVAPPGVLAGKFPASVTKDQLTSALQVAEKRYKEMANRYGKRIQK
jgi:hypothetical protein